MASSPPPLLLLLLLLLLIFSASTNSAPTPPSPLSSCRLLSPTFRLHWTLLPELRSMEIALEAAVPLDHYLALAWAPPPSALLADVVVAGFSPRGAPFAAAHCPCSLGEGGAAAAAHGLCPGAARNGSGKARLVLARRRRGVSYFRFRRPIAPPAAAVPVAWASGPMRLPYYLPDDHGSSFGRLTVDASTMFDECPDSLEAEEPPLEMGVTSRSLIQDEDFTYRYNNSVGLDDKEVTFFWRLSHGSISIAARGERRSGYLAIGFGDGMVNSYVYVGWIDHQGKGRVSSYYINGRDPSNLHLTFENLTHVRCGLENGVISFEFTRSLSPSCSGRIECENAIDPMKPLKVIWAMGDHWSGTHLSSRNMHSAMSDSPERVMLLKGLAEAEGDLRQVLAIHGFMMFVSWGVIFPTGILAARFLKHLNADKWYQVHVFLQHSGLGVVVFSIFLAAAELGGIFISSTHTKFGVAAIILVIIQPLNAFFRPNKEPASIKRKIWENTHSIAGRSAIIVGVAALFSGMKHFGERHDSEIAERLTWALVLWILIGVSIVLYFEHLELKRRRRDSNYFRGSWRLGDGEDDDDDLVNLLHPHGTVSGPNPHPFGRTEVQLQHLSR